MKFIWEQVYSSTACEIARNRCPVATIVEHDLSHPIIESFDVIVCSQTLEHVHYPDIALSNITAACKAGGLIILTVPDGRVDTYKGHINFWSPESWKIWIENHFKEGFALTFSTLPKSSGFSFLIAAVHRC